VRKPTDIDSKNAGAFRRRRRLRGMFSGTKGKAIGAASIAAPLVGLIANDLKNPHGLIRSVLAPAAFRLIKGKPERQEAIDITHEVEVLDDNNK